MQFNKIIGIWEDARMVDMGLFDFPVAPVIFKGCAELEKGVAYLVYLMCLFFWNLIATLFAMINELVRLQVWQTPSAKPAAAQVHQEITPPLAENKRTHRVSYMS